MKVCFSYHANQDTDKWFHAHPELSFQEQKTAEAIVKHLEKFNIFETYSSIGGHGVAAVLKNGPGKTLLLRADIDALPVEERSNLSYASQARMTDQDGVEKPVMHACGHDMHITALLGAAETLVNAKEAWSGTLILCFQPAEERASGAQDMIDDGLYKKVPEPDIAVGAHVMPERAGKYPCHFITLQQLTVDAGVIGTKRGLIASSADSFQ